MNNYNDIYEYLNTHVRDLYTAFDGGHDKHHFDEVYKAAMEIATHMNMNNDEKVIVAIAAAYHDVGRMIEDRRHEEFSVTIFSNDYNMKKWLTKDEMQLISNTIAEHRSSKGASTIYSKILKDADKGYSRIDSSRWIERVVYYNVDHCKITHDDPCFITVVTENVLARLNKLSSQSDWSLSATRELFGEKPNFIIPDAEEIRLFIESYLSKKEA